MRTVIVIVAVAAICIAALLTYQLYHPDPPPRVEYIEQIRYLPSDTIPRPYPVRVPVPVYIDTHQPRPQVIDTGAIVARYLERVAYTDTAINDTSAAILQAWASAGPATAQGEALSSRVKINGISRAVAAQKAGE